MNGMFEMAFDAASLAEIANLSGFATFLEPEVADAMTQASQLVAQAAQGYAMSVFENPTGALSESIQPSSVSPWEVAIGTDSPYARRWEYGFGPGGSAMTDSLGRTYHEAEKPFMQPALDNNKQAVLMLIDGGVAGALARLSSG